MSEQHDRNGDQASLARAIQDVTERAQVLVREEIELAKAEVTEKAKKLGKGAAVGAAAGVFVAAAGLMILHGVAWLLWYLIFPDQTIFWGFFMEAGLLLILAAIAGLVAARAFRKGTPPAPEMAIEEAKRIRETVQHPGTRPLGASPPPPPPAPAAPPTTTTHTGARSADQEVR